MENIITTDVAIIGGGISGLTTAYWLKKAGYKVHVLEKNDTAGGSMESVRADGYLFDRGPNSGLETTPLISSLVEELGLSEEFIYANEKGNKRYILRDNVLHELPMKPLQFLKSTLFSKAAKFRIFKEPFISKSSDGYYQSVAEFVERRLGKEFLDYVINPFVSGVYAGRPEELSVHSAFPKLYELEFNYGSILMGAVRSIKERKKRAEKSKQSAKMFSFINGMQTLPKAISASLGSRITFLADVLSLKKNEDNYEIVFNQAGTLEKKVIAKTVISTLPTPSLEKIISDISSEAKSHLEKIYQPPVLVIMVGYKKEKIKRVLDGFGYLVPEKENKSYLGAIWSSTLFSNRAPLDSESFTIFVGGSRNKNIFENDMKDIVENALKEFESTMGIEGSRDYLATRFWSKAIPQYNVGYIEHERFFDKMENENPGLFISGNFRGGISVGDCIKNSELVSNKVINFLTKNN